MKKNSMIEVVNELISQGHQVTYYTRKDGGILIKSIDGRHFQGAKGNQYARMMTGSQLSEAREAQLKYATRARMKKVNVKVPDAIKQAYEKVKKKWNRAFKAKGGKPHPAGYFGWKRIKESIKEYGEAEAMRRINEAERYASGLAYSKNVDHLADYIQLTADKVNSDALYKLAEDIRNNAYSIKEEWILPAYQELYKINDGVDPKQVAQNVRRILRL